MPIDQPNHHHVLLPLLLPAPEGMRLHAKELASKFMEYLVEEVVIDELSRMKKLWSTLVLSQHCHDTNPHSEHGEILIRLHFPEHGVCQQENLHGENMPQWHFQSLEHGVHYQEKFLHWKSQEAEKTMICSESQT